MQAQLGHSWGTAGHALLSTISLLRGEAAGMICVLCPPPCTEMQLTAAPTFCSSSSKRQAGLGISWILTCFLLLSRRLGISFSTCYQILLILQQKVSSGTFKRCCANKGETITKTSLCLKELTASPLFLPASVNKSLVMSLFSRGR